jgi:hypothetical protein
VKRVEGSPILRALVIILKTPLHHFHIGFDDFPFLIRFICLEFSFIIYPNDLIIPFTTVSCIHHTSLILKPLFDTFLIHHPMWVSKFVNLPLPLIPEYADLIFTKISKENLCSPPIHNTPASHIAIKIIGECSLIYLKDSIKEPSKHIEPSLFRYEIIPEQKHQEYKVIYNSLYFELKF